MPYRDPDSPSRTQTQLIPILAVVLAVLIGIVAFFLLKRDDVDVGDLEKDEAFRRGLYQQTPFDDEKKRSAEEDLR